LIDQAPVKNRPARTGDVRISEATPYVDASRIHGPETSTAPRPGRDVRTDEDVLRVADLSKSFRSGFLKRHIRGIEGVSFTVRRGSVFALLGHNGAGKTTTINCLLDLVHADQGEVTILGRDHRDPASRTRVGYLPERPYFFEHLTGRELLNFYANLLGLDPDIRGKRVEECLASVGMTGAAGRRLKKFSKGMLQRIGLAQALLNDPELLILDEPMSGLDPMGRREVRKLLLSLKEQGKTIILSSHIVPDIEMTADTVAILKDGRLVDVREMSALTDGCAYTGHVALPEAVLEAGTIPEWLPEKTSPAGGGKLRVEVSDVNGLRRLLNRCERHGAQVLGVDTRQSGLEELFLKVSGAADHSDGKVGS
jgi:ABC-2 type transport system ATP-binding protein